MAACLRGVGPATACAASWLQLTEAIHLWSDGTWPAQAAPGQVTTIGPHAVARVPVSLSLGAPQVVAVPMPREHAAVLYSSNHCVRFSAGTHGHGCSMAACLRGVGPATACAASWLQLTEAIHLWSDGPGLLRLHRAGHSHQSARGGSWASVLSLGAPQVVAVPMPRGHAAVLCSNILICVCLAQVHMSSAA